MTREQMIAAAYTLATVLDAGFPDITVSVRETAWKLHDALAAPPPDAGLVALVRALPEWDKDGYCVFDCGAHRAGASRDGNEVMAHIIYDHATEKVEHRRCGDACQQHAVACHWRTLQRALPAPTEPAKP